jgi:hypothetical protein
MTVFRRELAFAPQGSGVNTGDWWHLILDPDAPGLYVEHNWKHVSTVVDEQTTSGSQRFGINDFLTLAEGQPAQPMLLAALSEMFRNSVQDGQEADR